VGASGAISAVLGAYISLFPRQQVLTFVPPLFVPWLVLSFLARVPRFFLFWLPAWVFIGYWALLQVLAAGASLGMSVQAGGVAWDGPAPGARGLRARATARVALSPGPVR